MKNLLGALLFIFGLFILTCRAGDGKVWVATDSIRGFEFTKPCMTIDDQHIRCDGVVIAHIPKVQYGKRPAEARLQCRPEE